MLDNLSAQSCPGRTETIAVVIMGTFAPQFAERTQVYSGIANLMRGLGYRTLVMSLPKVGLGDFQTMLDQLEARIYDTHPECQVILIGHSQGATSAHALAHRRPDQTALVFAVSPPTHGTWLAALPGSRWVPIARHLATHSPQMRELRTRSDFPSEQIYVFYSMLDQFVLPFLSSQVRGANNFLIAPKSTWRVWLRFGQRASLGVTLVEGTCDHISIMMMKAVHHRIEQAIQTLPATLTASSATPVGA